jgi:hypothetical protein
VTSFSSSADVDPTAPALSSQTPLVPASRALLDAIPAHIAIVNAEGVITLINEAWAQFARENGDPELRYTGVGANYFTVCQQASGVSAAEARQALAGLLSVARGETSDFAFEYPCHSASEERWFLMRVRPLADVPGSLVITHINTTGRRRANHGEAETPAPAATLTSLEEERRRFERLFGAGAMVVTAQTFGLGAVREKHPEFFRECVQRYETLLDLALEQRVYRVEHPLTEQLRWLSEQLGFLRAGPRDVIDVHRAALQHKTANAPTQRAHAYTQEGRLLVVKLMGDLLVYYRALAMGKRLPAPPHETNTGGGGQGE